MGSYKQLLDKKGFVKLYNDFCKEIQYPAVVSAGGALLVMGMRELTDDLDLDVSDEIYDKYYYDPKYKNLIHSTPVGEYIQVKDKVSIHRLDRRASLTVIEGIACYSANDLLLQKLRLNREKDQEDIRKLRELLSHEASVKLYEAPVS